MHTLILKSLYIEQHANELFDPASRLPVFASALCDDCPRAAGAAGRGGDGREVDDQIDFQAARSKKTTKKGKAAHHGAAFPFLQDRVC